jgi:serine acetyltransferase
MVERKTRHETAVDGPPSDPAPAPWRDLYPNRPVPFWAAVREDVFAHVSPAQRGRSTLGWAWTIAKIGVSSPGFKVALLYRLNHALVGHGGSAGRVVAGVISRATHLVYRSAIAPRARLHGGLILPHPQGVIIGSRVVVGPRTWIFQNVTMGGTYGKDGEPTVGSDCRIYTGAVIGGPVTIGDAVVVSPNSLVQRNVPSRSMAVGVPANVFPQFTKPKPPG